MTSPIEPQPLPPKLTHPEMARLQEIGRSRYPQSCRNKPATTKSLIAKGLVEPSGGFVSKTGRIMQYPDAVITAAGWAVLKGLPKP